ncbi:Uncharacterized protein TCM_032194 [Theobroma cacao]|uniref:Uncharacterized protein n=1 Tax=Theobroma cacao TaxID=3641 RepID=A0A061FGK6_THECC|nr:Uncharacterized protein TCM_032194 [Theobroma cacao]
MSEYGGVSTRADRNDATFLSHRFEHCKFRKFEMPILQRLSKPQLSSSFAHHLLP